MTHMLLPTLRTEAFIDGAFTSAASRACFDTHNPATGQVVAQVASCDAVDVDRAVRSARAAFASGAWANAAPEQRKKVLMRLAALLDEHREELATLDALDAGKPITDCLEIDVPEAIRTFEWYAELCDKLYDSVAPTTSQYLGLILREPIGVVGAVVPWNFPLLTAAWKAAPALASGNSVIVKPAELSPLSALRLGELACEAGVPDGVLNVVPGLGENAGAALGRHPDVDMVSFTGSTKVGRLFLRYAAESNLKRIVLECGGKSPQIVLGDVEDLETIANEALTAGFWNMGENCSCGSRLIVDRTIKESLLERLVALAEDWRVGDPFEPGTRVGPLIEAKHLEKVSGYVEEGRVLEETGGYYFAPTIFDDVDNSMTIARDEIFGPVIGVLTVDTEAEAITVANDTNYGLAASVWTENMDSAFRVARAIRAGTVSVNCYSEGDITTPFGGYRESGFGGRDKGLHALDQYTEAKTVWIATRQVVGS